MLRASYEAVIRETATKAVEQNKIPAASFPNPQSKNWEFACTDPGLTESFSNSVENALERKSGVTGQSLVPNAFSPEAPRDHGI